MRHIRFWAIDPVSCLAISATLLISPALHGCLVDKNALPDHIVSESPSGKVVALAQTGSAANLSVLEQGIVAETNKARTNPPAYAAQLQSLKRYYTGNILQLPGKTPILTQEGVKPVDETIRFLKATKPVPPLSVSKGMSLAAKDHVKDQGPTGTLGHNGSDGSRPWDRVNRYGSWQRVVGENISYGPSTAQQVVMQLMIDDGVADRGHRTNMFKPDYRVTGVACGFHKQYRIMCDITYAGGYKDRR